MGRDHLQVFEVGGRRFTDPLYPLEAADGEDGAWLGRLFAAGMRKFAYAYDLGACWEHDVVLERLVRIEPGQPTLRCVAFAGDCPLEYLMLPDDAGHPIADPIVTRPFLLDKVNATLASGHYMVGATTRTARATTRTRWSRGDGPGPERVGEGSRRVGLAGPARRVHPVGPNSPRTGRKLTQTGRLTMADARMLVERLGTGDVVDPVIGDRTFRRSGPKAVRSRGGSSSSWSGRGRSAWCVAGATISWRSRNAPGCRTGPWSCSPAWSRCSASSVLQCAPRGGGGRSRTTTSSPESRRC